MRWWAERNDSIASLPADHRPVAGRLPRGRVAQRGAVLLREPDPAQRLGAQGRVRRARRPDRGAGRGGSSGGRRQQARGPPTATPPRAARRHLPARGSQTAPHWSLTHEHRVKSGIRKSSRGNSQVDRVSAVIDHLAGSGRGTLRRRLSVGSQVPAVIAAGVAARRGRAHLLEPGPQRRDSKPACQASSMLCSR